MESNINSQRPVYIGIVGYSSTKFDKTLANSLIRKSYDEMENLFGKNISIVSGYTNLGIPALAYREAANRGWKTVGVACERAKNFNCFECDEVIIFGKKWGDESQTFIEKIDVLVKIGGGKQSINELDMAKKMGKQTFEYELAPIF